MAKRVSLTDLNSVLASAEKKSKETPNNIPVLDVGRSVIKVADRWLDRKEEEEKAKTARETVEAELLDIVTPLRNDLCVKEYVPTVKVPSSNGPAVNVSWSTSYKEIKQLEEVKDLLGDDFDLFFREKIDIKVKPDVVMNDEQLLEIVKAVGAERFPELFDVCRKTVPKEEYTTEFHKVFSAKKQAALGQLVPQYKASVKK